jgi:DcaP outer membrane protein
MPALSPRLLAVVLLLAGTPVAAQPPQPPPPAGETSPPAQASPKVVEEGLFPKSFKIPGTDLSLGIGGYVKVDAIQDFGAIGDAYEFKTNSIVVGDTAQGGRTTIHARETRLNLDLRSSGTGIRHFRAFVEGDFYGDGNAFRLRHGYGEFGPLLGGQTWSTFQDISARGLTVDFEGPDGEVFLRQAMIRFTQKLSPHWTMAIAAENPTPQLGAPSDMPGAARATMPDIPGFVRYERGRGHLQVAGLVRQLRFDSTGTAPDMSTAGWGLNTTFVLPVGKADQVLGQFAIGEGTSRYIEGVSGQNLDAVITDAGALEAVRTQAGNLGYVHKWSATLKSGVSISTTSVDDHAALPSTAIDRLMDARANLFWTPFRLVDIAGEVLWCERRNRDGARGDVWRLQFAVIYRLN